MSVSFSTPDGGLQEVPRALAELSGLAKNMLEIYDPKCETPLKEPIILLKVDKPTLERIVEWMRRRVNATIANQALPAVNRHDCDRRYDAHEPSLPDWERAFFASLGRRPLLNLLNAANYMQIIALVDSGSTFISEQIAGMKGDEARKYLCIENDFTAQEEAALKEKYDWLEHM